jgi:hypothetical protein
MKIIPFKVKQETLLCGHCQDEEGLFFIGTDYVAICAQCSWTVILKTSEYKDLREHE